MRPLYDALFDVMEFRARQVSEKRVIEIAPLRVYARARPAASQPRPDANGSARDREPRARVTTSSAHAPLPGAGSLPAGEETGLPGDDDRRLSDPGVRRAPLGGAHARRQTRRQATAVPDTGRSAIRALPPAPLRVALFASPVQWPRREVPVDPYALGLLLGDGCITDKTSPAFATAEPEMVVALGGALAPLGVSARQNRRGLHVDLPRRRQGRRDHFAPLTQALRGLGLAGTRSATKFVPEVYLYNDSSVRLAVLQGLLDTDGGPVGDARRAHLPHPVRDDFGAAQGRRLVLVRSLGGVAYRRKRGARAQARLRPWERSSVPQRCLRHGHPPAGRTRALSGSGAKPRCTESMAPGARCASSRASNRPALKRRYASASPRL